MQLKRTINRLVADRMRGERGSGLIAVIGIAAVTAVIGVTVGTLAVNAMSYTTDNRVSLQARAAAEAGVNDAVAGLQTTGSCSAKSATYSSGSTPIYNATIQYKTTGAWVSGCPTSSTTSVRIESTGMAGTDQHTIEAIYSWTPSTTTSTTTTVPGSITESGSAVYTYGTSSGMTINDVTLTSDVSGKTADFVIKNTNTAKTCQSGTRIEGNLVIQNGSIELNACVVLGNLSVSGYAAVNSGNAEVKGNVSAAGNGTLYQNKYSAQVGAGAKVGGNVTGNGPMYLDGAVTGNVGVSGVLNLLSKTTITPNARINGNVTTAGSIDSWNSPCGGIWLLSNLLCALTRDGVVKGVISTLNITTPAPAVPSVPDWYTYAHNPTTWTNLGFSAVPWQGSCMVDNNPVNQVFIKSVMASTVPLVVDTRSCAKITFSKSALLQLKLNANVAFIGNAFALEDTTIDSATSAQVKAWFIVPGVPNLLNLCVNAQIDINNNTKVTLKAAVMVYTPGCVDTSSTEWRGQYYAGSVNMHVDATLRYLPIGLPGINLDTNATTSSSGSTTTTTTEVPGGLGTLTSMRDLAE